VTEDELEEKRINAFNDPEQMRIHRLLTVLTATANSLEAYAYAIQNVPEELHRDLGIDRDSEAICGHYFANAGRNLLAHAALMWPDGPKQMRAEIDHFAERLNDAGVGFFEDVSSDSTYHLLNDEDRMDENMRLVQIDLDYVWHPPVLNEKKERIL
jgi:hypothetical protein